MSAATILAKIAEVNLAPGPFTLNSFGDLVLILGSVFAVGGYLGRSRSVGSLLRCQWFSALQGLLLVGVFLLGIEQVLRPLV